MWWVIFIVNLTGSTNNPEPKRKKPLLAHLSLCSLDAKDVSELLLPPCLPTMTDYTYRLQVKMTFLPLLASYQVFIYSNGKATNTIITVAQGHCIDYQTMWFTGL